MCGIYKIVFRPTGEFYLGGTTKTFPKRFKNHRTNLKRRLAQPKLQTLYDAHGLDAFDFVPVEHLPKDRTAVHTREKQLIRELQPTLNTVRYTSADTRKHGAAPRAVPVFAVAGEELTLTEIARRAGVTRSCIENRVKRGLSGADLARPKHEAPRQKQLKVDVHGDRFTFDELAQRTGLKPQTLRSRYAKGLRGEDLVAGFHKAPRRPKKPEGWDLL